MQMTYSFPPEIRQLINQNMGTGKYTSEDDVLQVALSVLSDYHATIADVQQGLLDYQHGMGEPLEVAVDDVRSQLGPKL
jgi:Arc/MetJ-type ribon-helix-helix transcriptional regulator